MKKFKTKRNINRTKLIILIIVFLIIFTVISLYKSKNSYKRLTDVLLNNFNENTNQVKLSFLTNNLDKLFNNYSFYSKEVYKENKPIIYLYNTHDTEKYQDNKSILDGTKLLKNNLHKIGISSIYEKRKVSEFITSGLSSYDISRIFIKDIMNSTNNIAYYIDIHRDSVNNTTVRINNKKYAKIMFVLGLENENHLKNKEILLKMNDYLNKNYPGISRGIYEKKGSDVDGVYNQDLNSNIILIELGGIENNLEEVNNSTEILALMLYHILGD